MKVRKVLVKYPSLIVSPQGAPALELYLSQAQKDILSILQQIATNYNLSKKEYFAIKEYIVCKMTEVSLLNQRKGVCSGSLGQKRLFEGGREAASDEKTYEEIKITEKRSSLVGGKK